MTFWLVAGLCLLCLALSGSLVVAAAMMSSQISKEKR